MSGFGRSAIDHYCPCAAESRPPGVKLSMAAPASHRRPAELQTPQTLFPPITKSSPILILSVTWIYCSCWQQQSNETKSHQLDVQTNVDTKNSHHTTSTWQRSSTSDAARGIKKLNKVAQSVTSTARKFKNEPACNIHKHEW